MTQDVTKFDFGLGSESFQIRVIDHNGEPWWVLADVCQVLGMGNPSHAASRLDDDERAICNSYRLKSSHITKGDRGKNLRDLIIISESGLYSIILRSNKPEAKVFKKWVTSEVLPSIRKTGSYSVKKEYDLVERMMPWIERIQAYDNNPNKPPVGHFSIFNEVSHFVINDMIGSGVPVSSTLIPDISVGMAWSDHWEKNGFDGIYQKRDKYLHIYPRSYPQWKSGPQKVWCYPESALPEFRRWMRDVYFRERFPKYMNYLIKGQKVLSDHSEKLILRLVHPKSVA